MSKKHNLKTAAKEQEWPKAIHATSVDQVERLLNRPYGKPKVLSLNVSGQLLGDDLSGRIGKHMINNGKGLEELQLSENNLTPKTGERLAKGLVNSRTILILNLSQNSLGDRGAALLCKSLQSNLTLHTLNLSSNNIGSHSSHTSGCSGVASMTASKPPTITKSDWIVQLSTFLKVHKKIRHLNLADNLFGYKDVETMCESFHSPTCQLTSLNLSLNPIGDLGEFAGQPLLLLLLLLL
jgi:Ran GTPase-activating protein (RanGAP) involved in mRNA processing and transport